jgi:hypothetical protein
MPRGDKNRTHNRIFISVYLSNTRDDLDAKSIMLGFRYRSYPAYTNKFGDGFVPYAAPSTGAFDRNSPLGVRQGCRTLPKGQEAPSATPSKSEERRKQAASGCLFFWILFFGQAKKSISPAGARTGIQSSFAVANHCLCKPKFRVGTKPVPSEHLRNS